MRTCPDCAEEVKEAARVCRFCGFRFITPDERPDFTSYRMANGWSEADAGARPETRAEVEQFHYNRELYEKFEGYRARDEANTAELERLVARGVPRSVAHERVWQGAAFGDREAVERLVELGVPWDEAQEVVRLGPGHRPLPLPAPTSRRRGGGFFAIFGDPFGGE
jgi:hypothetical protein